MRKVLLKMSCTIIENEFAMSEMKQVTDMRPYEACKVFSHLEVDPSAISTSDSVKETDPKKSLTVVLWQSRPYRKENMTQSNQ